MYSTNLELPEDELSEEFSDDSLSETNLKTCPDPDCIILDDSESDEEQCG